MIRKWRYINSRESKKSARIHGKFIGDNIWVICKSAIYLLWNNKIGKFGKGNLSRSEPFFGNPNPCFDSLGRAGRENKFNRNILTKGWEFENLQLNSLEMFYLLKIKKFEFFFKKNINLLNKLLLALNCSFYWNFVIFERFKTLGWFFKSGIKYGGNFTSYKREKNKYFRVHNHSKAIISFQISSFLENNCIKCSNKCSLIYLNIQNKTRYSIFSFFFKKNSENNKYI